jgi:hypothetical protein
VFFSPTRPVREFSLAELVAKITELEQRQHGDRNDEQRRDAREHDAIHEEENNTDRELTE